MTETDLVRARLVNQLLLHSKAKNPADVVRHLAGIQAQDYSGGEWSVGLRLPGSTLSDVQRAIADGIVVRTWAMRGTLHFVAGDDIDWLLTLLSPVIVRKCALRYKHLRLDAPTFIKSGKIIEKLLAGGHAMTRKEIVTVLEKNRISCEGQRAPHILQRASIDRIICFGPNRNKQFTHVLFDEWIKKRKHKTRDEALAELAIRYFTSHGPATIQDYMWWSGLPSADAAKGLESVKRNLISERIGGHVYWMRESVPSAKKPTTTTHLLPGFDDFLLGYKDRSASLEKSHEKHLIGGAILKPSIIEDGKVVGTWERTIKKKDVLISNNLFSNRIGAGAALKSAGELYKSFVMG